VIIRAPHEAPPVSKRVRPARSKGRAD
jgi:hypothetical protein